MKTCRKCQLHHSRSTNVNYSTSSTNRELSKNVLNLGCVIQYTQQHIEVAGIMYRNICIEYGLDAPKSRWESLQKVVENSRAEILREQIQMTGKYIVVLDRHCGSRQGTEGSRGESCAVPNDRNVRKKEYAKLNKYQGLKGELERMWEAKATQWC